MGGNKNLKINSMWPSHTFSYEHNGESFLMRKEVIFIRNSATDFLSKLKYYIYIWFLMLSKK